MFAIFFSKVSGSFCETLFYPFNTHTCSIHEVVYYYPAPHLDIHTLFLSRVFLFIICLYISLPLLPLSLKKSPIFTHPSWTDYFEYLNVQLNCCISPSHEIQCWVLKKYLFDTFGKAQCIFMLNSLPSPQIHVMHQ